MTSLDLSVVRQQFPSLAGDWVFMDNAGGAQVPKTVVDRLQQYLLTSNVQHGASYEVSKLAGDRVATATQVMADFMGAASASEVVLGASTTLMLRILTLCLVQTWQPGDEVIVTNCDHEANIGAWTPLERFGIVIKFWRIRPDTLELNLDDLDALCTPRTRLVAVTHVSNVLGTVNPIGAIAQRVHQHNALICVDGVAYAPHRLIDVQAFDVDFYVFSLYKVFAPHQALLYGKRDLMLALPGFNHYFISDATLPYKFQPGNVNFELAYSLLGLQDYFSKLAHAHFADQTAPDWRGQVQQAFSLITEHEQALGDRLLSYLATKPTVSVLGIPTPNSSQRIPTISFVVEGRHSQEIPTHVDTHQIAIRWGDFYAKRMIDDLGLAEQGGVVRVSLVHYNTLEEVDRLIKALDEVL